MSSKKTIKSYSIIIILGCFILPVFTVASEWETYIFAGKRTNYNPIKTEALVGELSFRKSFIEKDFHYHQFSIGAWHRREHVPSDNVLDINAADSGTPYISSYYASYSIGVRNKGRFYGFMSGGAGLIDNLTVSLGTNYQFFGSLGFGFSGDYTGVECGIRHISNGRRFTGTKEINKGENFYLCGFNVFY